MEHFSYKERQSVWVVQAWRSLQGDFIAFHYLKEATRKLMSDILHVHVVRGESGMALNCTTVDLTRK